MNFHDEPVLFPCSGDELVGILTRPAAPKPVGIVMIVGGPQYRVGSHRQFLLLARALGVAAYPVLRFDHRGVGDSTGRFRGFEDMADDIRSAVNALCGAIEGLDNVVLWGLCEAASAAMMYAPTDPRVVGLALLNPWVRNDATLAQVQLKHYYGSRLRQAEFWSKLIRGDLDVTASLCGIADNVANALRRPARGQGKATDLPFQARMARGLRTFEGPVLAVLSGKDLTCQEFLGVCANDPEWRGLLEAPRVTRCELPESDHTFASQAWRGQVKRATVDWLESCVVSGAQGEQLQSGLTVPEGVRSA